LLALRGDWGGETEFPLTFLCLGVILIIAGRHPEVFPSVLWVWESLEVTSCDTKTEKEKHRIFVETRNKWMDKAFEVYNEEKSKLLRLGEQKLGLCGVCKLMEERCWREDKVKISLDKSTLTHHLNGVLSQAQSNANTKSWLTEGEADAIISYANQMASEGWPLSHRRILEHANEICFA